MVSDPTVIIYFYQMPEWADVLLSTYFSKRSKCDFLSLVFDAPIEYSHAIFPIPKLSNVWLIFWLSLLLHWTCAMFPIPSGAMTPHFILTLTGKNNVIHTNYFIKFFINSWFGEWLLINEKVILMMDLDENQ